MKKTLLTAFATCLLSLPLNAVIHDVPNLNKFEESLQTLDQHSLVLFDVDETLIVPKDQILNPYMKDLWYQYAKETIHNPEIVLPGKYHDSYFIEQIFSQMEYEVVDPKVIEIIRSLQCRKIKTIAFTRMFTGAFGPIPSMEDWRLDHLKKHHIDFSNAFPQHQEIQIDVKSTRITSLFKKGVLCANKQAKGPVLLAFLENLKWKPSKILLIDNRLDYLQSVESSLEGTGIEFIGFYYRDVENRPHDVKEDIARFQLLHLAKTSEWLSDEKAQRAMENTN